MASGRLKRRREESDAEFQARRALNWLARIAAKTEVRGECHEWTGKRNDKGYGVLSNGRGEPTILTHRAAWIARHGEPPPETPYVLHTCDNPPCWRDEHLFLGTLADNNADMAAKGRARGRFTGVTHCVRDHEFTPENTYVPPKRPDRRHCRTCLRQRSARRNAGRAESSQVG